MVEAISPRRGYSSARTSMGAPNPSANVTLSIPRSVLEFSIWSHRGRGGIGYEADGCSGVRRLPRHCSTSDAKRLATALRVFLFPEECSWGRSGRDAQEDSKAEDQSRSLEARPFARPKLVGVERECALGEAAVFRHGASLGTGLRPDALDRT